MFGFVDHPFILIALIVLNWPLYVDLARRIFPDPNEMRDGAWYSALPNVLDVYFLIRTRADWGDMQWTVLKLTFFLAMCLLYVSAQYVAIAHFIKWVA